ncbi:MAG TPA: hypothetical protein DEP85_04980, partial [Holosporales bacterium]|nr:hypothetical protein [Holosporales bacterium]
MFYRFFIVLFYLLCLTSFSRAETIRAIDVEGNRRVETPTIMSYIEVKVGEDVTEARVEEILKNLFATGLFAD